METFAHRLIKSIRPILLGGFLISLLALSPRFARAVSFELGTSTLTAGNYWKYLSMLQTTAGDSTSTISASTPSAVADWYPRNYTYQAIGGTLTYSINGGAGIFLTSGSVDSESFNYGLRYATFTLQSIGIGGQGYLRIIMEQPTRSGRQ